MTAVDDGGRPDEQPVGDSELAEWVAEARRRYEWLRRFRQRYLAASPDDRRELLRRDMPGSSSLTDIDMSLGIARRRLESLERAATRS